MYVFGAIYPHRGYFYHLVHTHEKHKAKDYLGFLYCCIIIDIFVTCASFINFADYSRLVSAILIYKVIRNRWVHAFLNTILFCGTFDLTNACSMIYCSLVYSARDIGVLCAKFTHVYLDAVLLVLANISVSSWCILNIFLVKVRFTDIVFIGLWTYEPLQTI